MSILRNFVNGNFTIIQNGLITDKRLSHGAFRVACYLMSKPDGWKVYNKDIQEQLGINQGQTLANYWKELLSTGVVSRRQVRGGANRFAGGFEYAIGHTPEGWDTDSENSPEYGKDVIRVIHTLNNTEHSNTKIERGERITGYFCQSTPDSPNEPPVSASSASSPASTSAPAPKSACSEGKRVGMAAVAKAGYPVAAKALQILRTLQVFTESQIALTVKASDLPIIEANLTALLDDNGATLGEYLEKSVERATAKKWLNLSMVSGVGLVDAHGNQLSPDDFVCFATQIMIT